MATGVAVARSPKLKVFCTPMGFYDALVAAPSQKAALKAWGTTTDLFTAGRASLVEDPALQKSAFESAAGRVRSGPGTPDRRSARSPRGGPQRASKVHRR